MLDKILVSAGGLLAIASVNWHFLHHSRAKRAEIHDSSGVQTISVRVDGGYDPNVVEVTTGRPVRLEFLRLDSGNCSEELVFPALGIRKFLPVGRVTPIEFTPQVPGTIAFTCGMGMLHGRLVVSSAALPAEPRP